MATPKYDDPKQVIEALKQQGITSLDELVKKAIDAQKEHVAAAGIHQFDIYKSGRNDVFWYTR
jgi:ABC-type branched-subunit amino acid transport system substrate-binding protein